jgi:hypothetical protein
VVECLPVVHGGIERNSSKVRTRGLQHFQPRRSQSCQFPSLQRYLAVKFIIPFCPSWKIGGPG